VGQVVQKPSPSKRGYGREAANRLLEEGVALPNAPARGLEKVFVPDGTGLPTSGKENYAERRTRWPQGPGRWEVGRRRGRNERERPRCPPKRRPVFGAGIIGARSKLRTSRRGRCDPHTGEISHFAGNLARTRALHPAMEGVLGDGPYAGRIYCRMGAEVGAVPRFLPRRNVALKREGVKAWAEMLLSMAKDPQRWCGEYDPKGGDGDRQPHDQGPEGCVEGETGPEGGDRNPPEVRPAQRPPAGPATVAVGPHPGQG